MAIARDEGGPSARSLRWIARVWSLLSLALLLAFLIGEGIGGPGPTPTPAEWLGLLLFPLGVAVGLVLAWWREEVGGLTALVCLAAFYLWGLVVRGVFPQGPYFALIAAPGLLFLLSGLLAGRDAEGGR